jgi:SAM-dependent methyltransferase
MHEEALGWVREFADLSACSVLDLGGRNVNGSVRSLFDVQPPIYHALDVEGGPGVDIVADAATWQPVIRYQLVVCTEVFEHATAWPEIVRTAFRALLPGGQFVATMAGPGRRPHSPDPVRGLRPGEHYANVSVEELARELQAAGFERVLTNHLDVPGDTRCVAYRPDQGVPGVVGGSVGGRA